MKTKTVGIIIGVPYAVFSLLLPHSLFRIVHVLFLSLGVVLGLSLIITERHTLKVKDSLLSGLIALTVFTLGSAATPFISFRTWILEESGEIVLYTGIQNWMCGIFFSMATLYLTLLLWFCASRKVTPVQEAGLLGAVIAAIPWTLSGKYGVPPEYDLFVTIVSFLSLAVPGFTLLMCKEFSLKKGMVSGGMGWSLWAFLVVTMILYTGPRMWIFPDNWDFIILEISYLAQYLPVWILFSILVLFFGKGITTLKSAEGDQRQQFE